MLARILLLIVLIIQTAMAQPKKIRIGVAGLTHTHVHWLLGREPASDVEIVGIAEPNRELAMRYMQQHGLKEELLFETLDEMLVATTPDAVTAFGTIFDHLEVVSQCAPRGIHVMVEKPLAVSLDHAQQMKSLADEYGILLLTNYETTWYATNHEAHKFSREKSFGQIRKIVVHDGHKGPEEIGVNQEFLEWLRDPQQNGAGALTDFGCYGANLITWLMDGERPETVTAITQTFKPEKYPEVDDEATIILTYPGAQGIIQASWNWPVARKDMEVYGTNGQVFAVNSSQLSYQPNEESAPQEVQLEAPDGPFNDPFAYLAAAINGAIEVKPTDLSALANNMIVMEILEAAKLSAREGTTIRLK